MHFHCCISDACFSQLCQEKTSLYTILALTATSIWPRYYVLLQTLNQHIALWVQKCPPTRKLLVGGFNPSKKNSQNGNLPQIGVKIKNCLKPPPRILELSSNQLPTHRFSAKQLGSSILIWNLLHGRHRRFIQQAMSIRNFRSWSRGSRCWQGNLLPLCLSFLTAAGSKGFQIFINFRFNHMGACMFQPMEFHQNKFSKSLTSLLLIFKECLYSRVVHHCSYHKLQV